MGDADPQITAPLPKYKKASRDRNWDKQNLQAMVDFYNAQEIAQWLAECYAKKAERFGVEKDKRKIQDVAVFYAVNAADRFRDK